MLKQQQKDVKEFQIEQQKQQQQCIAYRTSESVSNTQQSQFPLAITLKGKTNLRVDGVVVNNRQKEEWQQK